MLKPLIALSLSLYTGLLAAAGQPSIPDWAHLIDKPGNLLAIKACLAVHPKEGGVPYVAMVWEAYQDGLGVRTIDASSRVYSCVASTVSGAVESSAPVFESEGPLFVSVDQTRVAPTGHCIRTRPVMVANVLQGWLVSQRPPLDDPNAPDECSAPVWSDMVPR